MHSLHHHGPLNEGAKRQIRKQLKFFVKKKIKMSKNKLALVSGCPFSWFVSAFLFDKHHIMYSKQNSNKKTAYIPVIRRTVAVFVNIRHSFKNNEKMQVETKIRYRRFVLIFTSVSVFAELCSLLKSQEDGGYSDIIKISSAICCKIRHSLRIL